MTTNDNQTPEEQPKPIHGFVCLYAQKRGDFYAPTVLAARAQAAAKWKVKSKNEYLITVWLAEKNVDPETGKGTEVIHAADF